MVDKPFHTDATLSFIAKTYEFTSLTAESAFHIGRIIAAPIAIDSTSDITIHKKIFTACPIFENNRDNEYLNSILLSEALPHIFFAKPNLRILRILF